MDTPADGDRLSDEELARLAQLPHRYCTHDLDQWDRWRLPTADGEVYVLVSRVPPSGQPDQYDDLSHLL